MPGAQNSQVAAPTARSAPVQRAAVVAGTLFMVVGIAGFVPGITTDYDAMAFAGHHSAARLFGVFEVSVLHNVLHLVFGILALALAPTFNGARGFLLGSGVAYLALWIYGLVVAPDSTANFVPVNTADNWLHLGLGAALLAAGLLLGRGGQGRIGDPG